MDYLRIAARVSSSTPCDGCEEGTLLYDDGRDAYVCNSCGNSRTSSFGTVITARKKRKPRQRKAKPKAPVPPPITSLRENVLKPETEFSCQCELALSVDFEGMMPKGSLSNKLRAELTAAIKQAITITAGDMGLQATSLNIQPIKFDVAINDQSDIETEGDF